MRAILLFFVACSSTQPPTPTPVTEPPYRCAADADCTMSCAYGAVNRTWYEAAKLPECKDGCAEDRDAKCEQATCVAYGNGTRDNECTHRPITPP